MECTIRLTAVTQKISTCASTISTGAVTESEEFIHYSLSVEKLLDLSQDDIITIDSLPLCEALRSFAVL